MNEFLKDVESLTRMKMDHDARASIMKSDLPRVEKEKQIDDLWKDIVKRESPRVKCKIAERESSATKHTFEDSITKAMELSARKGKEFSFWYDLKTRKPISPLIEGECGVTVNFTAVIADPKDVNTHGFFHTHPNNLDGVFTCGPAGMDFITFSRNNDIGELVVGCPDLQKMTTVDISKISRYDRKEWGIKFDKIDTELSAMALDRNAFNHLIKTRADAEDDEEFVFNTSKGRTRATVPDSMDIVKILDRNIEILKKRSRKLITQFREQGNAYSIKPYKAIPLS